MRIAGERGILSVLDMHQDVFNRLNCFFKNWTELDVYNRFIFCVAAFLMNVKHPIVMFWTCTIDCKLNVNVNVN